MARHITHVHVTVDTEFSAGGMFQKPGRAPFTDKMVHCWVNGEDHGIGFIADTVSGHGGTATFFLEGLNRYYFGPETMAPVAQFLQQAKQDVQLHMHPFWQVFENDPTVEPSSLDPDDHLVGRSLESYKAMLDFGIESFRLWGLGRPIALRAGCMTADLGLYDAQRACNIPLASNVCRAIWEPQDEEQRLNLSPRRLHGVWEYPVASFQAGIGGKSAARPLQITSSSVAEMRAVLAQAHAEGIDDVVILTHPFEFIKATDWRYEKVKPNAINQRRLKGLCAFVAGDERFEFSTFSALHKRLPQAAAAPNCVVADPVVKAPALATARRMLENALNDRVWAV